MNSEQAGARHAADTECVEGIIVCQQANFYYVKSGDQEFACHMRGKLKKSGDTAMVGDRVSAILEPVTPDSPLPPPRSGSLALPEAIARGIRKGAITEIHPRTQTLERPAIANVDQVLVVVSADNPPFSHFLLDKFLVATHRTGLSPTIVINKRDLIPEAELQGLCQLYRDIGYQVIPTQAEPEGVRELLPLLRGKLSVLAGPSGVGKSSLVNALHPGLNVKEGVVSNKLQRGRHTTRHAALYPIAAVPDALLADTPGFSYLSLEGVHPVELGWAFLEMAPLVPLCKLPSCLHQQEPQCAVRNHPRVATSRYESYARLLLECIDMHRESSERGLKSEPAFKRRSNGAGKETKMAKIDANARNRDRRTHKQGLETYWRNELDDAPPAEITETNRGIMG